MLFFVISLLVLGPLFGPLRTLGSLSMEEHHYPEIIGMADWERFKTAVWVVVFAHAAISIYSGVMMLTKCEPETVVKMKRILWILYPVSVFASNVLVPLVLLPDAGFMAFQGLFSVAVSLIPMFLWVAYLNKSVRVRNTYHIASGKSESSVAYAPPAQDPSPAAAIEESQQTGEASVPSGFASQNEDDLFKAAWDEIQSSKVDPAVWSRAFAQCGGDEQKTKAQYITLRVARLKDQTANLIDVPHVAPAKATPQASSHVKAQEPPAIKLDDICPPPPPDAELEAETRNRVATEMANDQFDRQIYHVFWKESDSHTLAQEKYIQKKVDEALEANAHRRLVRDEVQDTIRFFDAAFKHGRSDLLSYWHSPEMEDQRRNLGASESFQKLCRAIRFDDILQFAQLLRTSAGLIYARNSEQKTALWIAVEEQNPSFVKLLLACGADANDATGDGKTLIAFADSRSNKDIVADLMAYRGFYSPAKG